MRSSVANRLRCFVAIHSPIASLSSVNGKAPFALIFVECLMSVNRRRNLLSKGKNADNQLHSACSAQQMSVERFRSHNVAVR